MLLFQMTVRKTTHPNADAVIVNDKKANYLAMTASEKNQQIQYN